MWGQGSVLPAGICGSGLVTQRLSSPKLCGPSSQESVDTQKFCVGFQRIHGLKPFSRPGQELCGVNECRPGEQAVFRPGSCGSAS